METQEKKLSDQGVFNKVWERAKDKRLSRDDKGKCRYRNPEGLACFIGIFLDDETAAAAESLGSIYGIFHPMDHVPGSEVANRIRDMFSGVSLDLLFELQRTHDTFNLDVWETKLRMIAVDNQLSIPE